MYNNNYREPVIFLKQWQYGAKLLVKIEFG